MKTVITKTSWEDVVFEFRNKEYGAYSLRRSYDKNITKASLIALLCVAFFLGITRLASLLKMEIKITGVVPKENVIVIPPIIIQDPPLKKLISNGEKKINKELMPRIVERDVVETPQVKVEDALSDETKTGMIVEINNTAGKDIVPTEATTPLVKETPVIFEYAEVMPAYEGGVKAMIRFISRNTNYPATARAIGQEGTVYVRFVINSHGQVVDVEVIKGVNAILDNEAVRVIALMSKWKPGQQHGTPVNVRMVLPIKFQLEQ